MVNYKRTKKHHNEKENNSMKVKKCPYCNGNRMYFRGPIGSAGQRRWKCKDCGKAIREQKQVVAPTPIVYTFAKVEG